MRFQRVEVIALPAPIDELASEVGAACELAFVAG
jgi:hypothetical protein